MIITQCILKNFKCYQATNTSNIFTKDNNIVGIIGDNGVGKSSILQGLNTFFNNGKWIRNKPSKKGPSECGVGLIVVGDKSDFKSLNFDYKKYSEDYKKKNKIDNELVYLGVITYEDKTSLLYTGNDITNTENEAKVFKDLIKEKLNYIYIDSELDIDDSLNISSSTATLIKGLPIVSDISKYLNQPLEGGKTIILLINEIVNKYFNENFIKGLKDIENNYDYKNITRGATTQLSKELLSQLAVQEIFKNKQLTKKNKTKDIGVSDMSSGQRRIALLDFTSVLIKSLEKSKNRKIILAIDEPEISVGSAGRIQQFSKLWELSQHINSIIFTTHYYGWINQYSFGKAIHIEESEERKIKEYNLSGYDDFQSAPFEMRMIFDFLISIGTWAEKEPQKKFIIVEGTTDKILINKFLPEFIVIKSRGDKVKKIARMLCDYNLKGNLTKNLYLLIDTDPGEDENIREAMKYKLCRRISRDLDGKIKVVKNLENLGNKATIEDLILGTDFMNALKKSTHVLTEQVDVNFINGISIKYPEQTGIISFGFDQVESRQFDKIFKNSFKEETFINFIPSKEGKKKFESLFKI